MVNMEAHLSKSVVAQRLPVFVTSTHQYWGSLVKICGTGPSGEETYFRLLYCDWDLVLDGRTVADSSLPSKDNQSGLALLVGRSINNFIVDAETHRVIFSCSDGLLISLTANLPEYEEDDQMLLMCLPDAYISYSPKLGLVAEPRSPETDALNT